MSPLTVLLLFGTIGVAISTFTLSGYGCGQPQIYQQCQCQNFCSGYQSQGSYYPSSSGGSSYSDYQQFTRHRPHHRRHHKKKFRFEHLESIDSAELVESRPTTTHAPRTTTNSWEDEDLWEKKFVQHKAGPSPSSAGTSSEEFPEIDSAEIEAARRRERIRQQQLLQQQRTGGGGLGGGGGGQGIGVHTGLGIGAPGIGGLGGGGGIFGISSGVGVGVPGVGPIGISSGLGIGKK